MQGNECGHLLLRTEVVDFIREHPDDFVPYMEDEEDFSSYCKRMSKAGILEPRATSKYFVNTQLWEVQMQTSPWKFLGLFSNGRESLGCILAPRDHPEALLFRSADLDANTDKNPAQSYSFIKCQD